MNEIALHGRYSDQDAVTSMPPGFILLVGDSGIGKSSFLSSLTTWPGKPLVSSPIVLKSVEGSLQTALADAISDCISQYLTGEPDARTAWTAVKSIGDRARSITGAEVGRAVLARILAYAEKKLGEEFVIIGKKVLGDVSKGGLLGFDDHLASIRLPDRAKDLCEIAAELSQAVGRPMVLRLDNAERLAPSDRGLLAELVESVVGPIWIVTCVTPHHAAGDEIVQQVAMRGNQPHELLPLAPSAIDEWLTSADVPPARWDTIIRLSSGYPLFITDAIQLSKADASLDKVTASNGFNVLMRESWKNIPEKLQEIAAHLAPFADPPGDDFLLEYLGFDILQWGILTNSLLESGIFIRRSDNSVWFHDRRRAFIWEQVLTEKPRQFVAGKALAAVSSWLEGKSNFELWVPSATAVLARAAALPAGEGLTRDILQLNDDGITMLWGIIEVSEPDSIFASFAAIGEVVRHAESRSGRVIDALGTMTQLDAKGLIETTEVSDLRLVRSKVLESTEYAALLGEIQLRFHATPLPRLATAAFDGFIRPLIGSFSGAMIALGESSLASHKDEAKALRDPSVIGGSDELTGLGATVTVDGEQLSFTAKFPDRKATEEAKKAVLAITDITSRVRLNRVIPLPQPRLRYARYRMATELLNLKLKETFEPTPRNLIASLDLRAHYARALGDISTSDESEVFKLGRQRFLVDTHALPNSWITFEVSTHDVRPTRDITGRALNPRDPLLELQLRADGSLTGRERIVQTVTRFGAELSIAHPLATVLDDIEAAGKDYNSGLRSVLFTPDPELLEREIQVERQRVYSVINALESAGVEKITHQPPSLLVGFWEDTDAAWLSDFGNWSACALGVDDGQGAVVVRRLTQAPKEPSDWSNRTVPRVFATHAGAPVTSWSNGVADAIIAPLLGYADGNARMMDLNTEIGRMIRSTYDIIGESEPLPGK